MLGGGGGGVRSAVCNLNPTSGSGFSFLSLWPRDGSVCVLFVFCCCLLFLGGGEGGVKFTSAVWSLLLVCLIPSVSSVPECVSAYVCVFICDAVHKFEVSQGSPFLTIPGLSCFQSWAVLCHRAAVRERGQDQKEIRQVGTSVAYHSRPPSPPPLYLFWTLTAYPEPRHFPKKHQAALSDSQIWYPADLVTVMNLEGFTWSVAAWNSGSAEYKCQSGKFLELWFFQGWGLMGNFPSFGFFLLFGWKVSGAPLKVGSLPKYKTNILTGFECLRMNFFPQQPQILGLNCCPSQQSLRQELAWRCTTRICSLSWIKLTQNWKFRSNFAMKMTHPVTEGSKCGSLPLLLD